MMRFVFISFLILISSQFVSAQGELPVDLYTGLPGISIPITTVTSHEISDPISLQYNTSGVRAQQPSGNFGIGWNLRAGGSITREVRGLPDDWTGVSSDTRRGWFFLNPASLTVAADVNSFANSADTTSSVYTDEAADNTKLNSYSYNLDTEPDVFSFNFGSYSGHFVFDNSIIPQIRLIPFSDLKITVNQAANKSITSFTVTTNDGVQYIFDVIVNEQRNTQSLVGPPPSVEFSRRIFTLYDYSRFLTAISYTIEWKLSKILSPLGASIQYIYEGCAPGTLTQIDTFKVSRHTNVTTEAYTTQNIYTDTRVTGNSCLEVISAFYGATQSGSRVDLLYGSGGILSYITLTDSRNTRATQTFTPTYTSYTTEGFKRSYLATLTQTSGCAVTLPYVFSYWNPSGLPGPFSKSIDFWGYFNGKHNTSLIPTMYYYPVASRPEQVRVYPIPGYAHTTYTSHGADRTPSSQSSANGILSAISWPAGGSTTITYESNQYYDAITAQSLIGGGLRIKAITYFDGINPKANIKKSYVYTDSLGRSTGRLITRPMFSIPTMQYKDPAGAATAVGISASDWTYDMVRTDQDLSAGETTDGSPIGYKEVKVVRHGAGYARYHYLLPGDYGSVATTSWSPTKDKFVRSAIIAMGTITTGGPWTFPFAPNSNFNHERGLVWLKQEYNDSSHLVRQTQSYYQSLYKASGIDTVTGVSYDYYPLSTFNTFFFGKYKMLTDVTKVLKTEKVTTYDPYTPSHFQVASTNYYYGTGPHRLLTQVTTVAPDGTKYHTRMKYPLDYGTILSGSDVASTMIGLLQTNFRNGSPVEQSSLIQKSGSSIKKYTGASLTVFNDFGTGTKIFPKYSYSLSTADPVDSGNYVPSFYNSTTKTFVPDNHNTFEVTQTVTGIDTYGNPVSSIGQNMQPSATSWGYSYSLPTVSIKNASATQTGFIDFETAGTMDFTITGAAYYSTGHTGTQAFYPSASLSRWIAKAPGSTYLLSFWINSTTATAFKVTLYDGLSNLISTINFSVPSSGASSFAYFSKIIVIPSIILSGGQFKIQLQAPSLPTGATGLLPVIDDVAFYPATASLTSYAYSIPFGVAATSSGNQTKYSTFDEIGRKRYTKDTNNNIIEKDTYQYPSVTNTPFLAAFTADAPLTDGSQGFTATTFPCTDSPTSYTWRIGSGTAIGPKIVGTAHQVLTVPLNDSITVRLIISNPAFGSDSVTHLFLAVGLRPIVIAICASGAANVQICTNTSVVSSVFPSYSCSEISAPPHASGLAMKPDITITETVTSCKWWQRVQGVSSWGTSPMQTTSSLASYTFSQVLQSDPNNGYDFKVDVTTVTADGRTRSGSAIISNNITRVTCP